LRDDSFEAKGLLKRGSDVMQETLFVTAHLDSFVPANHPLRPIRELFNEALKKLNGLFESIYADEGRESIAPEKLLRAQLLQVLYSIRSERQLVEQLSYNLLFRWFVGLAIDDVVWNHSTFSKNRDRLLDHEVIPELFAEVVKLAGDRDLLSTEHFSVDGTLIQAWASHKSFVRKDGSDEPPAGGGRNAERAFHGESRGNDTHASTTDPDSRSYKKSTGSEARLSFLGHSVMENRHGLIVRAQASEANGTAERDTALELLSNLPGRRRKTVGADKGYDVESFISDCRDLNFTPHIARNERRPGGSNLDARTTRHTGYAISQRIRKRIEESFGWGKTIGMIRQVKVRGLDKVNMVYQFTCMGWNLVRMRTLLGAGA
jgi:transposase